MTAFLRALKKGLNGKGKGWGRNAGIYPGERGLRKISQEFAKGDLRILENPYGPADRVRSS